MQKVIAAKDVRALERHADENGHSLRNLMYKAGTRAAQWILQRYPNQNGRVLILCGKGNNGGDGYVAARFLAENGCIIEILCVDGAPATALAIEASERLTGIGNICYTAQNTLQPENFSFVIDAVYGIGFHGTLSDQAAAVFDCVNRWRIPRIALDLPSGTECDSCRADAAAFRADYTLTFSCLKPVHLHAPSDAFCGQTEVIDLDIPAPLLHEVPEYASLLQDSDIARFLPHRPEESNKGTFGRALCICGSYGMAGAAAIAASGTMRTGCGLVQLAVPHSVYPLLAPTMWTPVFAPMPETDGHFSVDATAPLQKLTAHASAVLFGCGVGVTDDTVYLAEELVRTCNVPLVVDADGINALCAHKDILRSAKAPVILTPHPGEMARLTGQPIAELQRTRVSTARTFARTYQVYLVLKGHHTVIASPDGAVCICPTGNNGMAKGGSGDLLAGMLVSLLAQGMEPFAASCSAVYLHGRAGDLCLCEKTACVMLPTDLLETLPAAFESIQGKGELN